MHPLLTEKLKRQTDFYKKVDAFAKLLPLFEKEIIEREYTHAEFCTLAYRYKSLPLTWGVNWTPHTPTNYATAGHNQIGFVTVYINLFNLFVDDIYDEIQKTFDDCLPKIKVHFYDQLNRTFYFLPEEVEEGLNLLEEWYVNTLPKVEEFKKAKLKAKLEKQLAELSVS